MAHSHADALLAAAPDAVLLVGTDGRIVDANPAVRALFGYDAGELVGQFVEILVPDASRAAHAHHRDRYHEHPVTRPMGAGLHLSGRRRDGTTFPIDVALAPLESGGEPMVAAFVRDATGLRQAEERLQVLEMAEDRERIARDLHDKVIQRLFAAGMRLQAALGIAGDQAAERISQTVDDLDETIREIRTTIFELERPREAAASTVRERLLAVVADAGERLGRSPRVAFEGPLDAVVDARAADELLAVIREALSNVVRHAHATDVEVVVAASADTLTLTVSDDGTGPAPERRPGNGLRNMAGRAEALGGTFALEARQPRGSRLEWRVPLSGEPAAS